MRKYWPHLEVISLCVSIGILWILLSLPVIYHHLPSQQAPLAVQGNGTMLEESTKCPNAVQYYTINGACHKELVHALVSSNCLFDPDFIKVSQNEENLVKLLLDGIQLIDAGDRCKERLIPFLCVHLFGLHNDLGDCILPTSSHCEEIKDSICQEEWKSALLLGIELPDCELFPSKAFLCPAAINGSNKIHEFGASTTLPLQDKAVECSHGFFKQENGSNTCIPSCHHWHIMEERLYMFFNVLTVLSAVVGLLASVVVIVVSWIRRTKMFTFPSILIIYMVLDLISLSILTIINYMDRDKLFCSSENLLESIENVTPYCVFSGILSTYILCQMGLWWLFHGMTLFWNVTFPYHARSYENHGKTKYVHIVCALLGVFAPLVPITIVISVYSTQYQEQHANTTSPVNPFVSGGLGFGLSIYHPVLCFCTDRDVGFYSFVLPLEIFVGIGCSLLLITFWSIRRHNIELRLLQSKSVLKFGTAEKKLLIVLCYYVILAATILTTMTLVSRVTLELEDNIQEYFLCEESGHNFSHQCDHSKIDRLNLPSIVINITMFLLGLFPVTNLVYAVNVEELRDDLKKRWKRYSRLCCT